MICCFVCAGTMHTMRITVSRMPTRHISELSASLTPMFMSIISTRARYRIWDMKKSVQKHLRNQFCFRMVHNYLVRWWSSHLDQRTKHYLVKLKATCFRGGWDEEPATCHAEHCRHIWRFSKPGSSLRYGTYWRHVRRLGCIQLLPSPQPRTSLTFR